MSETNFAVTNPKQFYVIFSGKQNDKTVLSVESFMSQASPQEETAPQMVFGRSSRFAFNLISSGEAKIANMPQENLAEVLSRSRFICDKIYENELRTSSGSTEGLSPAYTVKMPSGEFKGKTPAEIILADNANKEKLNAQYVFLKNNLDKYPNNKVIMDAILDASALQKAGKLVAKPITSGSSGEFMIYSAPMRPLKWRKRDDGMCFVYDIQIKAFLEGQYPIQITIQNYYAPVVQKDSGMMNVKASQMDKSSLKTGVIHLSLKDWNDLLGRMDDQRKAFMYVNARNLFETAESMYQRNRAASAV